MSKIKTLALDIGHNTKHDIGAKGIKFEDTLNQQVGNRLLERLKETTLKIINCSPPKGATLTESLRERCAIANRAKADLFISIHHNACPGGHGCEALCIKGGIAEATGKAILEEISSLGFRNRGVKYGGQLYVINNTSMPALIIECAFVDSPKDMEGYNPITMADSIFKGLERYLELIECNKEEFYTVKSGDTLWGISRKFNTTVNQLVLMNSITDRNIIRVGQVLRVK